MKKITFLGLCFFCMSLLLANNTNDIGGWQVLGTVIAMHNQDHDAAVPKIPVNVKKLKFAVRDRDLTITKVLIVYDNGEEEILVTPMTIAQNGEGPTVDIKSGLRTIKRIDFWYDSTDFVKGKVEVTVFGKK
ncbi:hypothetical protein R1T16_12905 [Flavobacterium sp. DG1-102-2]|uniref:DUF2541 family protein n=1 Tax=Flavobacterium sp. DG1-102-2 TaxID=3081663 RepID=UPI0029492624|nr:hypothetical protein [Flavobacterium sp. DG1-102-2]MDV6169328.1 hypothetical protein [Flavobacterium sp. DG1-102-2]